MPNWYSPIAGFVGVLLMLGGAVVVFTTYALYMDVPGSTRYVYAGVIATLAGWLLQRIVGRRKSDR